MSPAAPRPNRLGCSSSLSCPPPPLASLLPLLPLLPFPSSRCCLFQVPTGSAVELSRLGRSSSSPYPLSPCPSPSLATSSPSCHPSPSSPSHFTLPPSPGPHHLCGSTQPTWLFLLPLLLLPSFPLPFPASPADSCPLPPPPPPPPPSLPLSRCGSLQVPTGFAAEPQQPWPRQAIPSSSSPTAFSTLSRFRALLLPHLQLSAAAFSRSPRAPRREAVPGSLCTALGTHGAGLAPGGLPRYGSEVGGTQVHTVSPDCAQSATLLPAATWGTHCTAWRSPSYTTRFTRNLLCARDSARCCRYCRKHRRPKAHGICPL
ncbi:uncharacterized protein LOC134760936 [Pongo abelii]|uniref:uncharacterized protein LOC134760936 n=1 Tax=Pongo abelii TaxID=9601 RepID=UPI00300674DF